MLKNVEETAKILFRFQLYFAYETMDVFLCIIVSVFLTFWRIFRHLVCWHAIFLFWVLFFFHLLSRMTSWIREEEGKWVQSKRDCEETSCSPFCEPLSSFPNEFLYHCQSIFQTVKETHHASTANERELRAAPCNQNPLAEHCSKSSKINPKWQRSAESGTPEHQISKPLFPSE